MFVILSLLINFFRYGATCSAGHRGRRRREKLVRNNKPYVFYIYCKDRLSWLVVLGVTPVAMKSWSCHAFSIPSLLLWHLLFCRPVSYSLIRTKRAACCSRVRGVAVYHAAPICITVGQNPTHWIQWLYLSLLRHTNPLESDSFVLLWSLPCWGYPLS